MKRVVVILLVAAFAYAEKARFDFYRVYEVSIDSDVHLTLMREISDYPDGVNNFLKRKEKIN